MINVTVKSSRFCIVSTDINDRICQFVLLVQSSPFWVKIFTARKKSKPSMAIRYEMKANFAKFGPLNLKKKRQKKTEQIIVRIIDYMILQRTIPAKSRKKKVNSAKRFIWTAKKKDYEPPNRLSKCTSLLLLTLTSSVIKIIQSISQPFCVFRNREMLKIINRLRLIVDRMTTHCRRKSIQRSISNRFVLY